MVDLYSYLFFNYFISRRDFRLVIGDPSDPSKAIPHPVVWESSKKILSKTETSTSIVYRTTFLKPISGWLAFFIQLSFEGIENSVIEITTEVTSCLIIQSTL
jgi:hypothetical protein